MEGCFLRDDQCVFPIIKTDVMFASIFEVFVEIFRVLLKKENVCFDLREIRYGLLQLLLFIEKTQLIERFQLFDIFSCVLPLSLLNFVDFVDIPQQSMEENEVILSHRLLLCLGVLNFDFADLLIENFVPSLFESLLADDFPILNAWLYTKLGRVSTNPKLGIKLAELPFELFSCEARYVLRNHCQEDETKLSKFCFELLTVELERTIHDAAVVKASNCQVLAFNNMLNGASIPFRDGSVTVIASHTLILVKYITESVLPFNASFFFAYAIEKIQSQRSNSFATLEINPQKLIRSSSNRKLSQIISRIEKRYKTKPQRKTKWKKNSGYVLYQLWMMIIIQLIKMNNELHTHRISSALTQIIYDILTNEQNGSRCFSSHYIVKSGKMFLTDDEFTRVIAQIQLTSEMSPARCVVLIERSNYWHILLASSSRIQLLSLSKREDIRETKISFKKLPNGFELAALSKSLALSAADVMIASTKFGSLLVIVFKRTEKQNPSSIQMIKVSEEDRPKYLLEWFTKQKSRGKAINELFLMRIDEYDNFFRLLSIKGEQIELAIIHLSLQTNKASIRKTHTINLTNSIIRTSIIFKQAVALSSQELEPREYEIVAAYQKQKKFITLVRISITLEQECKIQTSILSQFTPSQHFSMVTQNNALYFTYYDGIQNIYPLKKVKISKQESQTNIIHYFKEKIHFAIGNQLYILSPIQVFLVSPFHFYDSEDSQWLEGRNRMNVQYHQQIQRQLKMSKFEAVAILLEEKTSKLMELIYGRSQEDKFQEEISKEILCSVIMKIIFSYSDLANLMENLQLKSLVLLASTCEEESVRKMLEDIVNSSRYDIFVHVVMGNLMKMITGKISFDAIRQILTSPISICLGKLKSEKDEKSLLLFKELLEISIDFMAIQSGDITYLINQKESSFAKQMIVNNCFHEYFIHFFTNSLLRFTVEDLQTITNKLKIQGTSLLRLFVRKLILTCKELQEKNINFMSQKLQFLVKGLLNHYEEFMDEIYEQCSGLMFFIYLQARTKHEQVCIIHELAARCATCPYINTLFLSILSGKNAQNDEITMRRICKYIGVKYSVTDSSDRSQL